MRPPEPYKGKGIRYQGEQVRRKVGKSGHERHCSRSAPPPPGAREGVTAERPRLVVFRSNRGIFAQLVDDDAGRTLASASWLQQRSFEGTKTEQAAAVGKALAADAKKAGVETCVFDRAGYLYHGRVKPSPRAHAGRTSVLSVVEVAESRELKERVIEINRVAKVVKGGRRFSFTALVVIGDEVDRVGVGYGKAREVPLAISKAVDDAKKNIFTVPKHGATITHEITGGSTPRVSCSGRPARGPASSPGAASAPCSSSPGSATCSPRASARRTRSTWRRQRSTACAACAARGRRALARQVDRRRAAVPAPGRGRRGGARRRRAAGRDAARPPPRRVGVSTVLVTQTKSVIGQTQGTGARCARSGSGGSARARSTRSRASWRASCGTSPISSR